MTFEDNRVKFKAALNEAAERGVMAVCLLVEGQAKLLTPVDTGYLRDGVDHRVVKNDNDVEGQVGSNVEHAPFVEYGTGEFAENGNGRKGGWAYKDNEGKWHFTRGNKAKPFLRPAFRQNTTAIKQLIGEEYSVTFGGDV